MQKFIICCVLMTLGLFTITTNHTAAAAKKDKALVVVSFGTTFPETRELDLEAVENALAKAFPDRDFNRAFTAKIVMQRIFDNDGLKVEDLDKVLNNLSKQGYKDVLIQPTHLTYGEEYSKKIMATVHNHKNQFAKLAVGRPLLADEKDYELVARALETQIPQLASDEIVVFMGHGSPRQHNPAYNTLEMTIKKLGIPAIVGVVEEDDHPNFEDMLDQLKQTKAKKVLLMPLMLVSGDHANNDMAGEEEDSWLSLLQAEGYQVRYDLSGLGRNIAIQNIYVLHALSAL